MVVLRVASQVVLAIWVGGLAVLGFVAAPAIFSTLETRDPDGGRALAGLVFGDVLARFTWWTFALGAVLVLLLVARALLGPRPRRLSWRVLTVAAMVGISAAGAFVIAPRIDRIRGEVTGPVASLPDTDPRKAEFGRLHGASNVLMLVTLVAGLGLIWMETKDTH